MHTDSYISASLELHLFFCRIMKEHSFFLKAGFTPANPSFSRQAEFYKMEFEKLLCQALMLSDGIISRDVLCSGELVTEFTALAEKQTESFTGININKEITSRELQLDNKRCSFNDNSRKKLQVQRLNRTAIRLLDGLIQFKENILNKVLCCEMFTLNYPLLIEHIIREARLYRDYVNELEANGCLSCESMKETECFWNQIMMEHAMFIRGLLDPSENELFVMADGFAKEYSKLLASCHSAQSQTFQALKTDSLKTTIRFKEFKETGTQGIEQCKIRSVILPLLADHVLREANHYLRLLKA